MVVIIHSASKCQNVIIHSARKDEIRRQGVAIVTEKELSKCMTSYALTSERIMSVILKTNTGSVTIIQVHTPDSNYDDNEVLQHTTARD